ncbi:MAG: hypothetical protein AB1428_12890 [Bacteroidota bacterium]
MATNEVLQNNTAKIVATFTNEDGAAITSLDALKMTLYDVKTHAIINSRDAVDILASFSAGTLTLILTPADNAIVNPVQDGTEDHILLLEYTYGTTKKGSTEIPISVQYTERAHIS